MIIGVPGIRHAMISTPNPEWGTPRETGQTTLELHRCACQHHPPVRPVLGSVPVVTAKEQGCLYLLAFAGIGIALMAFVVVPIYAAWQRGFGALMIALMIAGLIAAVMAYRLGDRHGIDEREREAR